jgi:hypothetical protein
MRNKSADAEGTSMSAGVVIKGLEPVKRLLGIEFTRVISSGIRGIATELEGAIKPYGASGIWNSPENPTGRWYERGYGPHWWVAGAGVSKKYGEKNQKAQRSEILRKRRRGAIHARKTSEFLNRSWHVEGGGLRWRVFSNASYAPYLHSEEVQARWAKTRGWKSDAEVVREIVRSGIAQKIIASAIVAKIRQSRG